MIGVFCGRLGVWIELVINIVFFGSRLVICVIVLVLCVRKNGKVDFG